MGRSFFLSMLLHAMLGVLILLLVRSHPWPPPPKKTIFVSLEGSQARPSPSPLPRKPRLRGNSEPADTAAIRVSPPQAGDTQASQSLEAIYASRIRAVLEQRKHYPAMAKSLGQTGRVVLRFVVEKDGSISRSELLQKSPFPLLNRATKEMLGSATKLLPIPEKLHRLSWDFTVPVK